MKEVTYITNRTYVIHIISVISYVGRRDKKNFIDLIHYEHMGGDVYKITTETEAVVYILNQIVGIIPEKDPEQEPEVNKDLCDDNDDLRFVSF